MDDAPGMTPKETIHKILGWRIMAGTGRLSGSIMGGHDAEVCGDITANLIIGLRLHLTICKVSLAKVFSIHGQSISPS
jgi:hypothetical protein